MVIILVTLLEGMVWWYDDVQLNDDTWGGEWEWSNQGTIPHRFTTRWHFSEDVIIISPVIIVTSHHHVCAVDIYMESIRVDIPFEFSFLVRHQVSVLCFERIWGRFAPSPIHCNARNAQHLNAPPPKLVHRHSPLLHPGLPNLQTKLPRTTPVLSGAKPTWHIDLISLKLAPRCRYNLAAPFLL